MVPMAVVSITSHSSREVVHDEMGSTGDRLGLMRHKDELVCRLLGPVIRVLIRASTSGSTDLGLPDQKYATRKAVGSITGGTPLIRAAS